MPSHDPWHLADHRSLPMDFLLSDTLEILAIWDCGRLVQLWRAKVRKVQSDLRLYSLVAVAHRCIRGCSPSQRAKYRALDMAIMHWLQHQHGGAWLVADAEQDTAEDDFDCYKFDRLLVDGEHFAFDSQEWRPPWPPAWLWYQVAWPVRFYALQGRLCSPLRVHGYSLLREHAQADGPMCCDEYTHTLGSN